MIPSIDWSPIIATIIGVCLTAIIGGFFGYKFYIQRQNYTYKMQMYDQYLRIVPQVVDALPKSLLLSFSSCAYTKDELLQLKQKISQIYFANMLWLPIAVRSEFECFISCLNWGGQTMCQIEKQHSTENSHKKLMKCVSEEDQYAIIDKLTIVENGAIKLKNIIKQYGHLRPYININLQARLLIETLQENAKQDVYFIWTDNMYISQNIVS
ncbi:MAG: hypothetical protein MJZ20_09325 [Bacteroidaceae bacterium]|nr:hypothetical protein [Bacteroidaceae bacterium]